MAKCICGIDPGLSGAIAFFYPEHAERVAVYDMPLVDGRVNAAGISQLMEQFNPDCAVVELVGAMPGQGVTSMFNFGRAVGVVVGVLAAHKVAVHFPTPTKWKRYFALGKDKEESRRLAIERWPLCADSFSLKKHHGRAEACLLAAYGNEVVWSQSHAVSSAE
jgi:crossover junction endodeoxyribonuclease RuvC